MHSLEATEFPAEARIIEASFPWISSALADATDVASSRGLKPGPAPMCVFGSFKFYIIHIF